MGYSRQKEMAREMNLQCVDIIFSLTTTPLRAGTGWLACLRRLQLEVNLRGLLWRETGFGNVGLPGDPEDLVATA